MCTVSMGKEEEHIILPCLHISVNPKAASFVEGKHRWSDVESVLFIS